MSRRSIRASRAIVTGASSGIGRALALELARRGADVVLMARRRPRLEELAGAAAALGRRAEIVVGDITDPAVRQAAVEIAGARLGGLDILVNNAGIGAMALFEEADPQSLRRVMEVNFFALAEMTRLALPLLEQGNHPVVVNVSSVLGHRGVPYCSYYCASKAAVQGLSDSIRAELAPQGIDVLVVCPGTTQTEFFDSVIEKKSEPQWVGHAVVSAEHVARQTADAIARGRHEIVPSGWGRALLWLNRLLPGLMDRVLARYVPRRTPSE